MMMMIMFVTIFMLSLLYYGETMIYEKCELASVLSHKFHFDRDIIPDWICLIKHESNFDTMDKNGPNMDGSYDHGLFHINDHFWCATSRIDIEQRFCHVLCEELRSNDITESVKCAKKVFGIFGFDAWYGWETYCLHANVKKLVEDCNY